jgi:uncharacterized membrane protein YfcA
LSFDVVVFAVAVLAGAVASIAGFGIGSLLTPLFAVKVGTKLAVTAVSIPHLTGTAIRFWRLRRDIDRHVLWSFGITSAAGGLLGALLNARASSSALTIVFGVLLIFAGGSGLTGLAKRMRFHGPFAWIAGAVSGLFGGLVGNQGGIRSAALLGFDLSRDAFVATAAAIGLFVDGARMPVYLFIQGRELMTMVTIIVVATVGVIAGTLGGTRLLRRIPQRPFELFVSVLITALGIYMLGKGARWWA